MARILVVHRVASEVVQYEAFRSYEIVCASNVEDARNIVSKESFDALLVTETDEGITFMNEMVANGYDGVIIPLIGGSRNNSVVLDPSISTRVSVDRRSLVVDILGIELRQKREATAA